MTMRAVVKRVVLGALLAGLLAGPVHAEPQEPFVSGKEWLERMSLREKFMSLLPPTFLFNAYDIRLRYTLPQYIQWMDAVLAQNPQLKDEEISSVFTSTVFFFEPENRQALKEMEADFLRGDYQPSAYGVPRLSIQEMAEGAFGASK